MIILNVMKVMENYAKDRKYPGKRKKFLVMRNFSFSLSIFEILVLLTYPIKGLFGKGLSTLEKGKFGNIIIPFPNKPWFLCVYSTSLLKTLWEKEKLLVTSNFSFSHGVFYPFRELYAIFIQFEIVICKLLQIGRV